MKRLMFVLLLGMIFSAGVQAQKRPNPTGDGVLPANTAATTDSSPRAAVRALLAGMKQAEDDLERLRKKFDEMLRRLKEKEDLDSFQIQELMSDYNQMETLASKVLKRLEEQRKGLTATP